MFFSGIWRIVDVDFIVTSFLFLVLPEMFPQNKGHAQLHRQGLRELQMINVSITLRLSMALLIFLQKKKGFRSHHIFCLSVVIYCIR